MDVGALSLLISEKGFDATMAKVAALDAAGAKVGAKAVELRLAAPNALAVNAALGQVGESAARVGSARPNIVLSLIGAPQTESALAEVGAAAKALGQPTTLTVTSTGAATVLAAFGAIEAEKARVGAPATTSVVAPNVGATLAALGEVEAEKQKAGTPLAVPIVAPATGPALAALTALETAKEGASTPVAFTVTPPALGAAVGALAGLEGEKAKAAQPVGFTVTAPSVAGAESALAGLGTAKVQVSTPVTIPVVAPNVAAAVGALGGLEAEKAAVSGTPVTTTVALPNIAPLVSGLAALTTEKAAVSATPITTTVAPANLTPLTAGLGELATEKAAASATPITTLIAPPDVAPTRATLGALADQKAAASSPVVTPVTPPDITATSAALTTLATEKTAASGAVVTPVVAPDIGPTIGALEALTAEKQQAATPLTVPVLAPNVTPSLAALGALATEKAGVTAAPVTTTVTSPGIAGTTAVLDQLATAKAAVSATPVTIPVAPLAVGPALSTLGELETAKSAVSATPVSIPVLAPSIGPALAGLGAVVDEKAIVGAPVTIPVMMPDLAAALRELGALEETAQQVGATPVTVPVTPPNVAPATEALAGLEAEKAKVETPVVIPVAVPNTGPATTALSALAEAEALQAQRAAGLGEALAAAGATATTASEKVGILRAALDQDNASSESLSSSTLQLDRTQRDGVEVMRLRTQAINELRIAQEALNQQQTIAARNAVVATPANPIPTLGTAQLGPATPAAEDFAKRALVTKAAFEAEQLAAIRARAEIEAYEENARRAGNTTQALSPKLRSAAGGLTALAFAATSSGGSFQSMAMSAGLAASSIASMAEGPIAAWASGIGAAVIVGAALIGIFERMTDAASHAATAVDEVTRSIAGIKTLDEARAASVVAARNLAKAELELADAKAQANKPMGSGALDAAALAADLFRLRRLQKEVEQFRDIKMAADHQIAVTGIKESTDAQAARLEIITQGTAAENQKYAAASQAFLAIEQAKYATGRESLDKFFAARLAAINASGAREIAALKQRQALLAEPVADATPAESAKRAAEIRRIGDQIAEVEAKTREQTTQTTEERRQQRESLDRAIIGFELKEQEAAGDASQARIAQAKQEATQIARTLVQRSDARTPQEFAAAWADANARAQQFVDTQTKVIQFQQQQNAASRIFNELSIAREAIQQRVARGQISELQGEQEIAAEEKKRVPELQKIAAAMLAFATELKNPELIDAAKKLGVAIGGIAQTPFGPLEQHFLDTLKRMEQSLFGSVRKWADEIRKKLAEAKITITPTIDFVLSGIAGAIANLEQEVGGLAVNVGNSIGSSLAAGFSSAFTHGADKNFAEAFGNAMLSAIGGIMVQLGGAMLTYGLIMAGLLPFAAVLAPFAPQIMSAPLAIGAGTALIALGAGLGAIAANNTGHRTGGGGGHTTLQKPSEIPTQRVVLDPDRRLREARAIAPQLTVNGNAKATQMGPPVVNQFTIIGPNDPKVQRDISDIVKASVRRGLLPSTS